MKDDKMADLLPGVNCGFKLVYDGSALGAVPIGP
jgi:hypothetical protein